MGRHTGGYRDRLSGAGPGRSVVEKVKKGMGIYKGTLELKGAATLLLRPRFFHLDVAFDRLCTHCNVAATVGRSTATVSYLTTNQRGKNNNIRMS